MTNTIKKLTQISIKSLGYSAKDVRTMVEDKGEAVFVGRIGGIAADVMSGESKHGQWHGFKGTFLAVNKDGHQFTAPAAFFPMQVTNKLLEQFSHGCVEVDVKADIYAIETDKNASGYAYMCEPIMSVESKNKMEKLQGELFTNVPLQIENKAGKKAA